MRVCRKLGAAGGAARTNMSARPHAGKQAAEYDAVMAVRRDTVEID